MADMAVAAGAVPSSPCPFIAFFLHVSPLLLPQTSIWEGSGSSTCCHGGVRPHSILTGTEEVAAGMEAVVAVTDTEVEATDMAAVAAAGIAGAAVAMAAVAVAAATMEGTRAAAAATAMAAAEAAAAAVAAAVADTTAGMAAAQVAATTAPRRPPMRHRPHRHLHT